MRKTTNKSDFVDNDSGVSLFGALAVVPLSLVWSGFVYRLVWNWAVSPAWHQPHVTQAQAMAVSLVWSMLMTKRSRDDDTLGETVLYALGFGLVFIALAALVGSIV